MLFGSALLWNSVGIVLLDFGIALESDRYRTV
jgi:hypothetical protein